MNEVWLRCPTADATASAITNMVVRGAPAIGVTAAFGISVGLLEKQKVLSKIDELYDHFNYLCDKFAKTRPTAVNLFWAIERMKKKFDRLVKGENDIDEIVSLMLEEARSIFEEDVITNKKIGKNGLQFIKNNMLY